MAERGGDMQSIGCGRYRRVTHDERGGETAGSDASALVLAADEPTFGRLCSRLVDRYRSPVPNGQMMVFI